MVNQNKTRIYSESDAINPIFAPNKVTKKGGSRSQKKLKFQKNEVNSIKMYFEQLQRGKIMGTSDENNFEDLGTKPNISTYSQGQVPVNCPQTVILKGTKDC